MDFRCCYCTERCGFDNGVQRYMLRFRVMGGLSSAVQECINSIAGDTSLGRCEACAPGLAVPRIQPFHKFLKLGTGVSLRNFRFANVYNAKRPQEVAERCTSMNFRCCYCTGRCKFVDGAQRYIP